MTPPAEEKDGEKYDEQLLVRYLLGALSREELERLDELSIVDDDFACRLSTAENDLVDSYVRKELSPADAERFTSVYLSSPRRRQRLEFAETLLGFKPAARVQTEQTPAAPVQETPSVPVPEPPRKRFSLGWWPRLAFAGISLALLLTAGYLFRENLNLRKTMTTGADQQDSLLKTQQQLEQEVSQQRSANADLQRQLEQSHSQPNLEQLKTVALLLPPPMRGAARIPTLTIAPGTDLAVISLTLEADDFPAYRAALKDPSANRVLWQSGDLQSSIAGEHKTVSISFPAALLKQQMYLVELTGIPAQRKPENIAAYSFRVTLK